MRAFKIAVASIILLSLPAFGESVQLPGKCSEIPTVRGHTLQVDRAGNLWVWNRSSQEIWQVDQDLEVSDAIKVSEASAVAVEKDWGIAELGPHGKELTLRSTAGPVTKAIPLATRATDLAWIDGSSLALSTPDAHHLIEIWSVPDGAVVETVGQGEPSLPLVGARFLRSLVLEVSAEDHELHALESVTGLLRVFDTEGKPLRQAQIPAHRLPELEAWLHNVDEEARKEQRTVTPHFTVLRLAVTANGTDTVVEKCSDDRRQATVMRVSPDNAVSRQRIDLDGPVCSTNFTLWNDRFVFLAPNTGSTNGTEVLICKIVPETTHRNGGPS